MYTNNNYNPNLIKFARELRTTSISRAEKKIWKELLSRNQCGAKFKRQRPILNFIVDFYCQELKLVIEIDGSSHLNKGEYDAYRQRKLEEAGNKVIRFTEGDVVQNFHEVAQQIYHCLHCLQEVISS